MPVSGRWFRIVAAVTVLVVVAAVAVTYALGTTTRRVTAYFASGEGVFEDNSVRVLGVPVGRITHVEPQGTRVRVDMEITDDRLELPADVKAVVISPSVVTGRYVQLTPTYSGGPELTDGAVIPIERTAVPLGVDDLARTATQLATALGPNGANAHGALSDVLDVGAANLRGNGAALNQTVRNLGELSGTLADSRKELFGTVTQLQSFVSTVAAKDAQVRELNGRLADVARFLAGERGDLGDAFHELSIALGEVAAFVHDNRDVLGSDVARLRTVTDAVLRQRRALEEILDVAPAGLGNLLNAYNASSGTLDTRPNILPTSVPLPVALCQVLGPDACGPLTAWTARDPGAVITALRASGPGAPGGSPVPGLAVPTDPPGAIPDVTTLPGHPASGLPAPAGGATGGKGR